MAVHAYGSAEDPGEIRMRHPVIISADATLAKYEKKVAKMADDTRGSTRYTRTSVIVFTSYFGTKSFAKNKSEDLEKSEIDKDNKDRC